MGVEDRIYCSNQVIQSADINLRVWIDFQAHRQGQKWFNPFAKKAHKSLKLNVCETHQNQKFGLICLPDALRNIID